MNTSLQAGRRRQPVAAITIGAEIFAGALEEQGVPVTRVAWRPPAGNPRALARLLADERVDQANRSAVERMLAAHPLLVDIQPAREVLSQAFARRRLLHAGPPIAWERMCGPMRGAIIGACLYEGWASDEEEALHLAESGAIAFEPCHHYQAVGPMAGIISPSMPVAIIEDQVHHQRTFSTLNEGLGKVLRYGAYAPEVLARLRWMGETLGPALGRAIRLLGGMDVRANMAQALQMGDECHNRNKAATSLFARQLAPALIESSSASEAAEILRFLAGNDHFHLNLSMAAAKAITLAGAHVPHSSLVVTMARNGVDFGIRVSGLGDRWFVGPAGMIQGLYFAGYGPEDANPDIGDSAITETCGVGAFAMAAAPAIVQFIGGTPQDALRYSGEMYELTVATNPLFGLPSLNFKGTPTGIDIRQVCRLHMPPVINTGIAHRQPGVGQVGAGIVYPPMECFEQALEELAAASGA
ncbi:MAG TPA: DUF1116 domain-containing protein [Ktedonobacteraceae bacterium]|nr:DUF1116 domain-containing protein [Ktedonobacteraceae bacterium]